MKNEIPIQQEGGQLDTTAKAVFPSEAMAKEFYKVAKHRLLSVSRWAEICKVPISVFTLISAAGNVVNREAIEGDYIKIDIPGPATSTGDGFDWVRIEKISEETGADISVFSMQARPSINPWGNETEIAHFFKDLATSTFQIKQIGAEVYAQEHGRNEVPNTDTDSFSDNLRNRLVGWTAKIGLSYPQWKSLVKGIADTEAGD